MRQFLITGLLIFGILPAMAQSFQVGAAQMSVNPDGDTLYLAGGKKNRPFTQVHDSLYVKAVVIGHTKPEIAILTIDCIGLMYPQLLEIRDRVKALMPDFPTERIVMTSTHTHAGPDVVGIWGKDLMHSGVNPAYMARLTERAAAVIVNAWTSRQAARAEYATGQFGEDWVRNISEPELIDRSVHVMRFTDSERKPIATLLNFACHPTILDDTATACSADYVGGYYQYADSIQGGVNLFIQGAIGGWVQPEDVPSSYDNAMKYGHLLGRYALEQLAKSKILKGNKVVFRSRRIQFPVSNQGFMMLSKAGVIPRKIEETVATEIAFFQIGRSAFATHPGETSPALGLSTKGMMPGRGPKFIVGLGMDALGYILKPEYFTAGNTIPHSAYLCSMSIGPKTLPLLEAALRDLIKHKENPAHGKR